MYSGSSSTGRPTRSCGGEGKRAGQLATGLKSEPHEIRTSGLEMPVHTSTDAMPPRLANRTSVSSRSPMKSVRLGSNCSLRRPAVARQSRARKSRTGLKGTHSRCTMSSRGLCGLPTTTLSGAPGGSAPYSTDAMAPSPRVAARGKEEALVVIGQDEAATRIA